MTPPAAVQADQVLTFKNNAWRAADVPPQAVPQVPDLAGDVTGPIGANAIQKLQNVPLDAPLANLQPDQVLTFKNNKWQGAAVPAPPVPPLADLAGDVTGPPGANAIQRLQ